MKKHNEDEAGEKYLQNKENNMLAVTWFAFPREQIVANNVD